MGTIKDNGFIILKENDSTDYKILIKSIPDLKIVSITRFNKFNYILLQKVVALKDPIFVNIKDICDFKWMEEAKKGLNEAESFNKKIVFIAREDVGNGKSTY